MDTLFHINLISNTKKNKEITIPFQAPPADDQDEENFDEDVSEDEIEEEPENIATFEVGNFVPQGKNFSLISRTTFISNFFRNIRIKILIFSKTLKFPITPRISKILKFEKMSNLW